MASKKVNFHKRCKLIEEIKISNSGENNSRAAENDPPTKFLDLNDDCLENIFAYLLMDDLCAVKKTCLRFQPLADYQFPRSYSEHAVNVFVKKYSEYPVFECFGHFIQNLEVADAYVDSYPTRRMQRHTIVQLIQKHCQQMLRNVKFRRFKFDVHCVNLLTESFQNVKVIKFVSCSINENYLEHFMMNCPNIGEVVVYESTQVVLKAKFLQQAYPTLKMLRLINVKIKDERLLNEFFNKNQQIKYFIYAPLIYTLPWLQYVNNNGVQLEGIYFEADFLSDQIIDEDLAELQRIKTLKYLIIKRFTNIVYERFASLMASFNSLTSLGLINTSLDMKMCIALGNLTDLKVLMLFGIEEVYEDFAKILSTNLKNLEKLYFDRNTIQITRHICPFIENCPKLTKLHLQCHHCFSLSINELASAIKRRARNGSGAVSLTIYLNETSFKKIKESIGLDVFNSNAVKLEIISQDMDVKYYFWSCI